MCGPDIKALMDRRRPPYMPGQANRAQQAALH